MLIHWTRVTDVLNSVIKRGTATFTDDTLNRAKKAAMRIMPPIARSLFRLSKAVSVGVFLLDTLSPPSSFGGPRPLTPILSDNKICKAGPFKDGRYRCPLAGADFTQEVTVRLQIGRRLFDQPLVK